MAHYPSSNTPTSTPTHTSPSPTGSAATSLNPYNSVLAFIKGMATPVVLYSEAPTQLYEALKETLKKADPKHPKLIEKTTQGPLRQVCFWDSELAGVALQWVEAPTSKPQAPAALPTPSFAVPTKPGLTPSAGVLG